MATVRNLAADVDVFTSNVFLVEGQETVLIDAGANFDVVSNVEAHEQDLDRVVLTHTHHDHVENLPGIIDAFDVDVAGFDPTAPSVNTELVDGDTLAIGDLDYRVLHTPGHKEDHVCLLSTDGSTLFTGDLVFAGGGFGRTDLEEGDRPGLVRSIERVLEAVDDDLAVFHSGHGPSVSDDPVGDIRMSYDMAR